MCGIAGIVSKKALNSSILLKMSEKMSHRGPDGEGFTLLENSKFIPYSGIQTPEECKNRDLEFSPKSVLAHHQEFNTAFIHRRLAIIDTHHTGHQPMCNQDASIWITYNGEIYNYIELRAELQKAGFSFKTQSDTEVILAAYQLWGKDCLNHFNGMWAFAIADLNQNKLFIARDRFAVKPLYYYTDDDVFMFASEQKIILHSGLLKAEVNPEAVFDYFTFGEIEYQTKGFFKSIDELFGGHYIETSLSNPKIEPQQWYNLNYVADNAEKQDFSVDKISELISDAVKLRLRADVEVGSCLSGGLDSSAIVGYMNKHLQGKPFHVFTATFPGLDVDEGHWAKLAAENTSAERHESHPDRQGLILDLEELTYAQDIPIWSTSTYAQFKVMKLVNELGVRVVLDGQGGDEIFGGYHPHEYFLMKGMSFPERLKYMLSSKEGNLFGFYAKQKLRFDTAFKLPNSLSKGIFSKYFKDLSFLNKDFYNAYPSRFTAEFHPAGNNLNERLSLEMQNTSLKAFLKCEDRCSMWHSVESRTPFSDDHHLIEYLFSIPGREKIKNHQLKYLLREAAGDYIPEKIKNRQDKQGYTTPNKKWISEIAPEFKEIFNDNLSDYLNVDLLLAEYKQFFGKDTPIAENRMFKFLSFAMWHKVFIAEFADK